MEGEVVAVFCARAGIPSTWGERVSAWGHCTAHSPTNFTCPSMSDNYASSGRIVHGSYLSVGELITVGVTSEDNDTTAGIKLANWSRPESACNCMPIYSRTTFLWCSLRTSLYCTRETSPRPRQRTQCVLCSSSWQLRSFSSL